jgi:hypothetical protein
MQDFVAFHCVKLHKLRPVCMIQLYVWVDLAQTIPPLKLWGGFSGAAPITQKCYFFAFFFEAFLVTFLLFFAIFLAIASPL